jgi:hypothetical protein
MPPQWQGSEDILIPDPQEKEIEAEEEEVDEDDPLRRNDESVEGNVANAEILDSEDELAL